MSTLFLYPDGSFWYFPSDYADMDQYHSLRFDTQGSIVRAENIMGKVLWEMD